MFLTEDLITFNLRNFLLFQLWESSFSPGAGGFCTTLPPSFLRVDDRATSSTTDSSRATKKKNVLHLVGLDSL
eukprot:NP_001307382.1 protein CROC-4 isoform 2 [Homo sapiens]